MGLSTNNHTYDKFKLGKSITYGGFTLEASVGSAIKIISDKTRLNDLLDISPPTTKTELNSFFGLINTFKIWSPALNPHSPILRALGRKYTVFSSS